MTHFFVGKYINRYLSSLAKKTECAGMLSYFSKICLQIFGVLPKYKAKKKHNILIHKSLISFPFKWISNINISECLITWENCLQYKKLSANMRKLSANILSCWNWQFQRSRVSVILCKFIINFSNVKINFWNSWWFMAYVGRF